MACDEIFVLEGEMSNMISLMNKIFYSDKEIFLRELLSNASNALDKIQFERFMDKSILDYGLNIRLVPHKVNKTLSIIDTGIGMTKSDLANNLGVGFYSAYLVAHKVIVTSKYNDHDQYIWESQSSASFSITKDINVQQPLRGTKITLFLKDNQLEYLEKTTIKNLVIKYYKHISHPIYLWTEKTKDHWQLINIWLPNQEMDKKFVTQNLMNYLPDDLIFSILFKLPLKSLKRFGCLQRSWALLIENSHFMNLFRKNFTCNHHSYYNDTSLLLRLTLPYGLHYKSTLFSVSGERFQSMEKLYWPDPLQEDYPAGFCFLGSSSINGILCLYLRDTKLGYFWNPTIDELKVIPPSQVEFVPLYVDAVISYHGFGYDSVRDDYKVIRNVCFFENNSFEHLMDYDEREYNYMELWEMYSLRSNSWKKLKIDIYLPSCRDTNDILYLEGMCHWLGFVNDGEAYLVSFNLSNEVVITTLAPLDVPLEIYDNFNIYMLRRYLLLLNGSIALMSNYTYTTTFYISILVEMGKKESWTKLFVFGPVPCIAFPIGTRNMGIILFQTHDGDLAWFDLSTHTIEKLGVKVHGGLCQLVIYKENLLPIERINS